MNNSDILSSTRFQLKAAAFLLLFFIFTIAEEQMTMENNGKLHFGIIVIQQQSIRMRMNKTQLINIGLQDQNRGHSEAVFICYLAQNVFYLQKHHEEKKFNSCYQMPKRTDNANEIFMTIWLVYGFSTFQSYFKQLIVNQLFYLNRFFYSSIQSQGWVTSQSLVISI